MGARDRIREFLIANVGKVVTTQKLRKVGGISEYARRIRELRDEEGYPIKSHVDRADLKPGEYILETIDRKPVIARGISPQLRNEILERNGFTCQLWGPVPATLIRSIQTGRFDSTSITSSQSVRVKPTTERTYAYFAQPVIKGVPISGHHPTRQSIFSDVFENYRSRTSGRFTSS